MPYLCAPAIMFPTTNTPRTRIGLYMWYLWKASDVSVESLKNTTSSSGAAAAAAKKKKAPAKKASGPE